MEEGMTMRPVRLHNKSRHRMSGNNINLKFDHRALPLIGALYWSLRQLRQVTGGGGS
jgi:hypothetical protein